RPPPACWWPPSSAAPASSTTWNSDERDEEGEPDPDDRREPPRPPRLRAGRALGGGSRASGERGQIAPRRQRQSLRRLRPASRRRALPRQLADRALQGRRRLGPRALARPQAPFAPRRDRSDLPARAGKGLHADPDATLLQERPGQGGDRAGAREIEAGPPRGDQGKGEPPRDRPRHRR